MLSRQKAIIISPGSDGGRFTPQVRAFLRATCLVGRSDQGAIPRARGGCAYSAVRRRAGRPPASVLPLCPAGASVFARFPSRLRGARPVLLTIPSTVASGVEWSWLRVGANPLTHFCAMTRTQRSSPEEGQARGKQGGENKPPRACHSQAGGAAGRRRSPARWAGALYSLLQGLFCRVDEPVNWYGRAVRNQLTGQRF